MPRSAACLPRWSHTRLRALPPPWSVPHRWRPGQSEVACEAKGGAVRTENTLLGAVDLSGRLGSGSSPYTYRRRPHSLAPVPDGGWEDVRVSSGRLKREYLGGGTRGSAGSQPELGEDCGCTLTVCAGEGPAPPALTQECRATLCGGSK